MSKKQLGIVGGSIAGVIILVVVILVVTGGSTKPSSISSPTTIPALSGNLCPLTDLPAAGGAVPPRPALLVKIGNEPEGARPQSGLNEADIVYDTPAEGFVMRYIAVYQCTSSSSIGPTRSVRWVDTRIARQYVDPILAFAGGINPNVDAVASDHWLFEANLLESTGEAAGHRITSRVPPDNLYTSTSALYSLYKTRTDIPKPVFAYSPSVPSGATATSSIQIFYSEGTDPIWTWSAKDSAWLHSYTNGPDIDQTDGQQVSATNVVVQSVHYKIGPYIESTGGSGDIESQTLGTGPGMILRNGKMIKVTWHRKDLLQPMTFTDANGAAVKLAPGRTWVEVVPDDVYSRTGGVIVK
jgi:Protein of unknown function (DUF3048) N-terminal domain/Protein of unknown function (DUF3048) C-terminal domain